MSSRPGNLDLYLAWQLVRRNAIYQRTAWLAVVTALVEPAVYFAAVAVGLSRLVDRPGPAGYALFTGPALVAICAMNGAVAECTNNVFFRWRQGRLYDSALCTPLSAGDIALGDLIFGTLRGWLYGTIFLALLMIATGAGAAGTALAFLGVLPVAWMFAAMGLLIVSVIRTSRQLQYVHLALFAMLLSANTFVDVSGRGPVARGLVDALPLTYANGLLRACSRLDLPAAGEYAGVVGSVAIVGSALAIRRLSRKLGA